MKEKDFKSSVEKMLLKKAMGYKVKENVDEYASVGEEMKLVKRRITTKYVSPDLAAAKTLLGTKRNGGAHRFVVFERRTALARKDEATARARKRIGRRKGRRKGELK